jgi:hypothetical protein
MADDLDALVVAHLREVHAELHGLAAKSEEQSRRLDKLDSRLAELRPNVEHTVSLVTLSQVKLGKLEARSDTNEAWQRRVDTRLAMIESRLGRVEQKLSH